MNYKCKFCGQLNEITIKSRSSNENRYFHGIILPMLSDFTGHTAQELKLFLKKEFGWIETKQVMGKVVEVPMSTAQMTTTEFEKFMTQIRQWGDTIGVYLPEPGENN